MDNDFHDWEEDYNPFAAIGFAHITQQPPSQRSFAKAIQYARFVANPSRLDRTPQLAAKLPHTLAQIEKAINFFAGNGNGSLEWGRERPDDITWEWAYESIIIGQSQGLYTREWAPEKMRIENVLLDTPITVDVGNVKTEGSREAKTLTSRTTGTTEMPSGENQLFVTQSSESLSSSDLEIHGLNDTPCDKPRLKPSSVTQRNQKPLTSPSQHVSFTGIPKATKRSTTGHTTGHKAPKSKANAPAAPGTYNPKVPVFIGFLRPQVLGLLNQYHTRDQDFRQPVFGCITAYQGRIHYGTHKTNMAGIEIPPNLITQRGGHVRFENILLAGEFTGLSELEARLKLASKTLVPNLKNPRWLPTPDMEVQSNAEEIAKGGDSREPDLTTTAPGGHTSEDPSLAQNDNDNDNEKCEKRKKQSTTTSDYATALSAASTPEGLTPPHPATSTFPEMKSSPQHANVKLVTNEADVRQDFLALVGLLGRMDAPAAHEIIAQLGKRPMSMNHESEVKHTSQSLAKKSKLDSYDYDEK